MSDYQSNCIKFNGTVYTYGFIQQYAKDNSDHLMKAYIGKDKTGECIIVGSDHGNVLAVSVDSGRVITGNAGDFYIS